MRIKVKIAVAANDSGDWYACGSYEQSGATWEDVMGNFDRLDREHQYWVEADLEIPDEIPVIAGSVSLTTTDGD